MKTIALIVVATLLMGCSKHNLSVKKAHTNHKTYISDNQHNANMKEESTSSPFTYTLSSFMPTKETSSDEGMSWMAILQDSDILYYLLSIISFITIGLLILTGIKNKDNFKVDKSLSA